MLKMDQSEEKATYVTSVDTAMPSGTEYPEWGTDVVYTPHSRMIKYDRPNYRRYGNCLHVVERHSPCFEFQADVLLPLSDYPPTGNYITRSGNDWARFYSALEPFDMSSSTDANLETLSAEAYEAMVPSFETDLSITNFLLELRDIKRMFKVVTKNAGKLRNLANGHLNFSFGWKPFLADVIDIIDSLVDWRDRLWDLYLDSGTPQVRHFTKFFEPPEYPKEAPNTLTWKQVPVYHATMKYIYELPEFGARLMGLRVFLDSIGAHINAAVVWEAIPFSFVVDWVFDVQGFLEQFSQDWVKIDVKVIDFCSSIKWHYVEDQFYIVKSPVGNNVASTPKVGQQERRFYKRARHIPGNFYGINQANRYGARQIALSGSLLVAVSGRKR